MGALLGGLHFLSPLALWAFASLPLLWWLLRLTPPSPKRVVFPALILLRDLSPIAQSPAHTPWWLLLLRLALLTLLFLGLARPVFAPKDNLPGTGTIVFMVDNSWSSAAAWPQWQAALRQLCEQAEREQRDVLLLPTTPEQRTGNVVSIGPAPALTTCPTLSKLQPHPWSADHGAINQTLTDKRLTGHHIFWFSDGLQGKDTVALYDRLMSAGNLTIYQDERPRYVLQPAPTAAGALAVTVARADSSTAGAVLVTAQDKAGRTLGLGQGSFKPLEKTLNILLDLPPELRNLAQRLVLQDSHHAGGVWLLDGRNVRHKAGLIGDPITLNDQPLLNGLHYLDRAVGARNLVQTGPVAELIAGKANIILNTNERALLPEDITALETWLEKGGVLVQFAGATLDTDSPLLPVPLRQSRRDIGGIFSWGKPQSLQAFPANTPFHGLAVPNDIQISQQLLADPAGLNGDSSWALLTDGTPLVTGARRGSGLTVLFHVPAYPGWSNLPLSGLFVQMLERLVNLAATGSVAFDGTTTLAPNLLMDAYGQLLPPAGSAQPLTPAEQASYQIAPEHPPGYYGQPPQSRAFNLGQGVGSLLPFLPDNHERLVSETGEHELRPWLLLAALLLFLFDMGLALWLRGLIPQNLLPASLALLLIITPAANAGTDESIALSENIWLGYVTNGAGGRSSIAARGLQSLAVRVKQKTAVEDIGTLPINLEQDDLSLVPLLYWPLTENPQLSSKAINKLQDFLAHGGMVLIDLASDPENNVTLRESGILLPMMAPVTPEHPLFRTFYLMQDCPGRTLDGSLWSESDTSGRQDYVSGLFIGSRDWAGAWASEGRTKQQEQAMRCGLNLVMHALTGNYKMDQVHMPVILERMQR